MGEQGNIARLLRHMLCPLTSRYHARHDHAVGRSLVEHNKCEHTQRNGQVFKAAERGTRVQRRLGLKIRVEFRWGRSRHRERPESGWVRRSRRQSGNAAQVVSEQAGFPPVSYRAVVGDGR